jgi:hypothetical protein
MAEQAQTPPTAPAGTGDGAQTPPAAPQTPQGQGGTSDEVVTIPKKELEGLQKSNKDLLSQRDKNANRAEATEAWVMEQAKKQDVSAWLKSNKAKFADVSVDDLMNAESEEELPALAEKMQARIDKATQKKLLEIQTAGAPSLTPEQKAEKLAKLKGNNAPTDAFEQMVDLQLQR